MLDNTPPDEVRAMPESSFQAIYARQEAINAHSENVLLQAKRFGTPQQVAEAEAILRQHERRGYLDPDLYGRREQLRLQLDPAKRAAAAA